MLETIDELVQTIVKESRKDMDALAEKAVSRFFELIDEHEIPEKKYINTRLKGTYKIAPELFIAQELLQSRLVLELQLTFIHRKVKKEIARRKEEKAAK